MNDHVIPPRKILLFQNRKLQAFYLTVLATVALFTELNGATLLGATIFGLYVATFTTLAVALCYVIYVGFQHV